LYLAVPVFTHEEFFSEEVVSLSVVENGVKLLIFDPEAEEVVQWKS
jgi:nucleoside 2-deoxyribosyltransferase